VQIKVNNINWNSGILEFLKYRTLALRQEAKLIKGLFEATTILHDEIHASV